jgi:hypothetical protein
VLVAAKLILGHSAVAHPADPGTQEVFQMIKNIPNKENRVIGVITKCDRKQEGADNWVHYLQWAIEVADSFRFWTRSRTKDIMAIT